MLVVLNHMPSFVWFLFAKSINLQHLGDDLSSTIVNRALSLEKFLAIRIKRRTGLISEALAQPTHQKTAHKRSFRGKIGKMPICFLRTFVIRFFTLEFNGLYSHLMGTFFCRTVPNFLFRISALITHHQLMNRQF